MGNKPPRSYFLLSNFSVTSVFSAVNKQCVETQQRP
jgi:hypothetical protein